jgi:hypothetical protein
LESAQVLKRLENGILGVFAIVQDVLSDSEELPVVMPVVSLDEFLEGSDLPAFTGMDKI